MDARSSDSKSGGIGKGTPGPGRGKGNPNKATILAREAVAKLVDNNAHRLEGWLDEIAADPKHGPIAAWKCMMDVIEYHIPKLARTELTGKDGEPIETKEMSENEIARRVAFTLAQGLKAKREGD